MQGHNAHRGQLTDTIEELLEAIASGEDLSRSLGMLARRCRSLLNVAAVGVLLADETDDLAVAGAPDENLLQQLFESQRLPGPVLDCYRSGTPVSVSDARDEVERRSGLTAMMATAGLPSLQVLPMRAKDDTVGALSLFRTDPLGASPPGTRVTQVLATVVASNIVLHRSSRRYRTRSEQLQGALDSRVIIEQAKGVLAERHHLDVGRAFELLRGFARRNRLPIHEVAKAVIGREINIGLDTPQRPADSTGGRRRP